MDPNSDLGGSSSISGIQVHPRFLAYAKGNHLPPPDILKDFIEARSTPLQELQHLDRNIQVLYITVAALKRRYDVVKMALSVYEPILAPIRRIPEDMLDEIFYHCLPTTRNARPFVSESPLLLTLVCKKWRGVALSSPRLWSTLHLPVPYDYIPPLERHNRFACHLASIPNSRCSDLQSIRNIELNKWLVRSRSLPLSISLFAPSALNARYDDLWLSSTDHHDRAYASETLNLIIPHANRLSELEVVMPIHTLRALDEALATKGGNLTQLRRVRVSVQNSRSGRIDQEAQHLKLLLVNTIQELSLDLHSNFIHLQKSAPWSTELTELSLHTFLEPMIARQILRRCTNLQTCSLHLYNKDSWPMNPSTSDPVPVVSESPFVQLSALHTLSIRGLLAEMGMLCMDLHAPALTRILLYPPTRQLVWAPSNPSQRPSERELDVTYPPSTSEILCSFLLQCTHLNSLIINPAYLYGAEVQAIFDSLPQIETLVLDNDCTHRPGSLLTSIHPHHAIALGHFHYTLHPLLKQERVSKITGERIHLSEPLLPNLKSFSWNQFSGMIPNKLLVSFLKNRLHPSPAIADSSIDHPTRSLSDINIKFITDPASGTDIEAEITQHASAVGLNIGVDFTLRISTYPWVKRMLEPSHQYVAPMVAWPSNFSQVSEDNLLFDYDATWPLVDI